MKNLKPSQLPEGTVIDDQYYGEYIKRADGLWEEMDRDMMGDREWVSDAGYDDSEDYRAFLKRTNWAIQTKSDDYFTSYRIVASDPEFRFTDEKLHGDWLPTLQAYSDGRREHFCKGYNCDE